MIFSPQATDDHISAIVTGDLDNDGDLDVVAGSSGTRHLVWYRNDLIVSGNFSEQQNIGSQLHRNVSSVVVGHVDNDENLDVVTAARNDDKVFLYHNLQGEWTSSQVHGEKPESVALGDIDGDGKMDVLVGLWVGSIVWYRINLDGSFLRFTDEHVISPLVTNRVLNTLLSDIDGEDLDVVSGTYHDKTVTWYRNDKGNFVSQTISLQSSYPHTVMAGDLDNDGDPDLVGLIWYRNHAPPCLIDESIHLTESITTSIAAPFFTTCASGFFSFGTQITCGTMTTSWSSPPCNELEMCFLLPCDYNADCQEVAGIHPIDSSGRNCSCATGYSGIDFPFPGEKYNCTDILSCLSFPCALNAFCTEYVGVEDGLGGRKCECLPGFYGDGELSGTNCSDYKACETYHCDPFATCQELVGVTEIAMTGGRICECNVGYIGSGEIDGCFDVQSCISYPCDKNAECIEYKDVADSKDGRQCICKTGFVGDGEKCTDVLACQEFPCDEFASCTEIIGGDNSSTGRTCTCIIGFNGTGETGECADYSACVRFPCDKNAKCIEIQGGLESTDGRICECEPGFRTLLRDGECVLCDPGYFCSRGIKISCPQGSTSPPGSSNASSCSFCEAGQYCPEGLISQDCSSGTTSPRGSYKNDHCVNFTPSVKKDASTSVHV
eukprot:Lithocolla_globosa_v1_NODE_345_length_4393_cov_6.676349.p1 type:complete len:664 gc:universal NODE_345_length_4393_cov_6.676349:1910-3901(+)